MSVINEQYLIADKDMECNACLFLVESLEDLVEELTFAEKRAIVKTRKKGWKIVKGELYRTYTWVEDDYAPEPWEIASNEYQISTINEIPAIANLCKRLNLYP